MSKEKSKEINFVTSKLESGSDLRETTGFRSYLIDLPFTFFFRHKSQYNLYFNTVLSIWTINTEREVQTWFLSLIVQTGSVSDQILNPGSATLVAWVGKTSHLQSLKFKLSGEINTILT